MHIVYIGRKKDSENIKEKLYGYHYDKYSEFKDFNEAITASQYLRFDLIFLKVETYGKDPIGFYNLRKLQPAATLIFITKYDNPAAGLIKSSLFELISPNTKNTTIQRIIQNNQLKTNNIKNIYIQMIPKFNIFINGQRTNKIRGKQKELLAFILDSNGNYLTKKEIITKVWPNQPEENTQILIQTYYNLKKKLKEEGISELIKCEGDLRYSNKNLYKSDLSDILDNLSGLDKFTGQYLEEYPEWNGYTKNLLNKLKRKLIPDGSKK